MPWRREAQKCNWAIISAGEIRYVTHGSTHPSLKKLKWRWGYPGEICGGLLFSGLTTQETHKIFENIISAETTWLKGTETGWNIRRQLEFQNFRWKIGLHIFIPYSGINICYLLRKRKNSLELEPPPESIILRPWNLALLHLEITWTGQLLCLLFFPSWNGAFITAILCVPHHHSLATDNLTSSFTDQQMDRNFASRWIITRVSPIPDLDV